MLDKFKSMQNLDSEGMIKIMQSLDSVALGIISSMQSLLNVQWRSYQGPNGSRDYSQQTLIDQVVSSVCRVLTQLRISMYGWLLLTQQTLGMIGSIQTLGMTKGMQSLDSTDLRYDQEYAEPLTWPT